MKTIKQFFNSLTGRIVLGELLIHFLLIPVLMLGIFFLVEEGIKQNFIDQSRRDAFLIADLIKHNVDNQKSIAAMDDTIISGRAIFVEVEIDNQIIKSEIVDIPSNHFVEDFKFQQHDDNIFFVSMVIQRENNNDDAILRIGYDETSTVKHINKTWNMSLVLGLLFVIFTVGLSTFIGPAVTRSVRKISRAAREIASGNSEKQIDVTSSIIEVSNLASDLEKMRVNLITQNNETMKHENHLIAIMENVVVGIITINEIGVIESFNQSAEKIFGFQECDIVGQQAKILFADTSVFLNMLDKSSRSESGSKIEPVETTGLRKNNQQFTVEIGISKMTSEEITSHIIVVTDITKRKETENALKSLHNELEHRVENRTNELATVNKELKHQALHDALTGLPNRVLLQDRLKQSILTSQRNDEPLAFLMLDLDRFKEINDTLGHHCGDELLIMVSERFSRVLRKSDTVARLGGDEFAILLPSLYYEDYATDVAKKISNTMNESFILNEQTFHIGVSVGISLCPQHGSDCPSLMRQADVAMYVSKRNNSEPTIYDPKFDEYSVNRLSLMGDLKHAIDHEELVLHYQPKIDINSNKVFEVEALIRWNHPTNGLLYPLKFIDIAEQTGLIKSMTMWVIKESIRQCHTWQQLGLNISIAVNLSPKNLHDPDLCTYIAALLKSFEIDPRLLSLEITESTIMTDPDGAMETLKILSDMGILISLDDFGTGYSSLSYLKRLPVNEIKIDRTFVMDLAKNKDDNIIVQSTIDLAHNMGRKVIAEGVEDKDTFKILTNLGCDGVQGNFFSKPLSANNLRTWFTESKFKILDSTRSIKKISN